MAKKVNFTNDNIVHGVFELSDDFTFCTLALAENEHEFTHKKITCEDCIRVVKFYKSVKATEMKK